MKSLHMGMAYTDEELRQACLELVAANGFREDMHVCVVAYFGMGPNFDTLTHTDDAGVHITSTPAPRSGGYNDGVAASISSWRRISDDGMPPRIKAGANYHNSRLAQHEAVRNGFNTAPPLNQRGRVSEAPGSCVVMVRDGELVTPPGTSGVLEGITVATVAELAREHLGIAVEHREIDRTELYAADELFRAADRRAAACWSRSTACRWATASPAGSPDAAGAVRGSGPRSAGTPQWSTPVVHSRVATGGHPGRIMIRSKEERRMTVLTALVAALRQPRSRSSTSPRRCPRKTPVIELPPERGQPWRFGREVISHYDAAGPTVFWNNIRLSEHTGTHFDAPVHWLPGRDLQDVSQVPAQKLVGRPPCWTSPRRPRPTPISCCVVSTSRRGRTSTDRCRTTAGCCTARAGTRGAATPEVPQRRAHPRGGARMRTLAG